MKSNYRILLKLEPKLGDSNRFISCKTATNSHFTRLCVGHCLYSLVTAASLVGTRSNNSSAVLSLDSELYFSGQISIIRSFSRK